MLSHLLRPAAGRANDQLHRKLVGYHGICCGIPQHPGSRHLPHLVKGSRNRCERRIRKSRSIRIVIAGQPVIPARSTQLPQSLQEADGHPVIGRRQSVRLALSDQPRRLLGKLQAALAAVVPFQNMSAAVMSPALQRLPKSGETIPAVGVIKPPLQYRPLPAFVQQMQGSQPAAISMIRLHRAMLQSIHPLINQHIGTISELQLPQRRPFLVLIP